MGDVYTTTGTKVYIGPSVTNATDTSGEFAALTPWVEIGLVENLGEFGDAASTVSGSVIGDSRVRKSKGADDAGEMTITVFDDPTDAGQLALVAAQATKSNYAFKLVAPNRLNSSGTDGVEYFRGIVMGKRKNYGSNDNLVRRTFNVGINSSIIEVAPTAGS